MTFEQLAADHRARLSVSWAVHGNHLMGLRNRGAKGNGAVAMREVTALADRLGATLVLATSAEKLIPYYEGFGFKPVGEIRTGDYRAVTFRRRPN